MLSLQIFNISDPTGSSNYALYEVSVTEEGITKTKRLPDSMQNLAERIGNMHVKLSVFIFLHLSICPQLYILPYYHFKSVCYHLSA